MGGIFGPNTIYMVSFQKLVSGTKSFVSTDKKFSRSPLIYRASQILGWVKEIGSLSTAPPYLEPNFTVSGAPLKYASGRGRRRQSEFHYLMYLYLSIPLFLLCLLSLFWSLSNSFIYPKIYVNHLNWFQSAKTHPE